MKRIAPRLTLTLIALAGMIALLWSPSDDSVQAAPSNGATVVVKFTEGSDVRLRHGRLVSLSGEQLTGVDNALARVAEAQVSRLFSRSESELDSDRARGQAQSNKSLADLNLFYHVRVPRGLDAETLIDGLGSLEVVESAYLAPEPAPLPVTPDFEADQGHLDAAPDGIGARIAWQIPGGRGAGITIADVEYSWNTSHEDLPTATAGKILLNAGESATDPFSSNDHGTAVLGELIAANNGFGVTGIASDADIRMAPADIDGAYDVAEGINRAAAALGSGDVILIEQQTTGANGGCNSTTQNGCVGVEFNDAEFAAIQAATALGIIVVEAAGNGSEDLDSSDYDGGNFRDDSGAIMVGAGAAPGGSSPARSKLGFSTFGSRVDVQGWGNAITSTGYGDKQGSSQSNDAYTDTFGGTSGASPIVTGAVAAIQGTRLARGEAPLTPTEMRNLLKSTGTPQQDNGCTVAECPIGPLPNLAAALTTDLAISKFDYPDPVVAGEALFYQVTVNNLGPNFAPDVMVVDTLPAEVDYVIDDDSCVESPSNTLTCSLGDIPADEWRTFTIRVDVDSGVVAGAGGPTVITNQVSTSSAIADPVSSNNAATATTFVEERSDLRILKECKPDQPNAAPAGTETFCDIYVDNLGPSDARAVVMTDQIIGSVSYVVTAVNATSTSGSAGACVSVPAVGTPTTASTITCTDSVLPAGARNTYKVRFTADDPGDIDDTATVTSETPDPDNSNNHAVGRVSFAAGADVTLDKAASPDPVIAGETITWTITVANNGPSAATGVVVKDDLPGQVTNVSVFAPGGACNAGVPGNPALPLTCNMGNLSDGASEVIIVEATVKPETPFGTILFNQARANSATSDPNNSNNNDSVPIVVETEADLAIVKWSDAATYKPNTTISYRITVTNNGPSHAQNVVVVDTLPDPKQVVYLSTTGPCVFAAPKTLTCNLGSIAPGEVEEFFVYVKVRGTKGSVVNRVDVSSGTFDASLGNNTSTRAVSIKGKP